MGGKVIHKTLHTQTPPSFSLYKLRYYIWKKRVGEYMHITY